MDSDNILLPSNKLIKSHISSKNHSEFSTCIYTNDSYQFEKNFFNLKNIALQIDLDKDNNEDSNEIKCIPKPQFLTYMQVTSQDLNKISNLNLNM